MEVRLALPDDLNDIFEVYETARQYMLRTGNPTQWGTDYPPEDMLREDVAAKRLYVAVENGKIHGAFAFFLGDDPTYAYIEGAWKNALPYGTIHRIASDGELKGVFRRCLNYCLKTIGNIRIDTHADNLTMQHVLEKNGFEKCGVIYVVDGSPRVAYQFIARCK
jgi:hypothetical protein